MDVLANVRSWAAPQVVDFLDQILKLFPEELKYRLKQVIDSLPPDGDNMQKILELVRAQWKDIRSDESVRIAIVGPGRTGKSSLYGSIVKQQIDPGVPIFTVVDVQGLDEYLGFGSERDHPKELETTDLILLVLDGRYDLSEHTVTLYERLRGLKKPLLVALNKMDLVSSPAEAQKAAKTRLKTNVLRLSLYDPQSVHMLLKAIVASSPRAVYPLSQNFPAFRRAICNGIVTQSAFAASVVGAVPIPVSDLLPMTAIQTAMLLKIARAYGYPLNRERARELFPALVAGVLVREGIHRLRRRYPDMRKLIAVTAAGSWTFLLGRAAIQYFDSLSRFAAGGQPELPADLELGRLG